MPDFDLDAALAGPGDDGLDWIKSHASIEEWDEDDNEQATSEGWGVFGDGWGTMELQALNSGDDVPIRFRTDGEAWQHVWDSRRENYTCAKALYLLRQGSPREFESIRKHVS